MVLTIKAVKFKGKPLKSPLIAEFDEEGGKLGRSPDSCLVLSDEEKFVSSEHATISYENGDFFYIDTSLNGSEFTKRNKRIHQNKILIEDQDTLRVGDYELVLSLSSQPHSSQPSANQRALSLSMFDQEGDDNSDPPAEDIFSNDVSSDYPEVVPVTNNDDRFPGDFPDLASATNGDDQFQSDYPDAVPATNNNDRFQLDGSFAPPVVVSPSNQPSELPEDFGFDDFFNDEPPAPVEASTGAEFGSGGISARVDQPPPVHQPPVPPPPVHQPPAPPRHVEARAGVGSAKPSADILNVFFKAAGIDSGDIDPQQDESELMHTVGLVFRDLIDGLMMVLRGRSELKSHLRVSMTILKATENNPLKFSTTAEEALTTLLTKNHPGFVDAVDAVREGFENIKNHQMALNAGVQASLASSLKRFEPRHFSEKFSEGIVLQKKAKCWDEYRQAYQQIVQEAIDDFFGEHFVRAYEKQIEKLRAFQDSNDKKHER